MFVGSFGNLLAFVYVSAVVARTMERAGWDRGRVVGLDRETLGRLIVAVLRAALIVVALLLSIVGIPWAIRQLIRYQLVPQAVALEGHDPRTALERSSALVRGRWWWTAGVIAVMQMTIAVVGVGTALLVLVLVTVDPTVAVQRAQFDDLRRADPRRRGGDGVRVRDAFRTFRRGASRRSGRDRR